MFPKKSFERQVSLAEYGREPTIISVNEIVILKMNAVKDIKIKLKESKVKKAKKSNV